MTDDEMVRLAALVAQAVVAALREEGRTQPSAIALAPVPSAELEPSGETVLRFPTVGAAPSWALSREHVTEWQGLFPSVDVEQECRSALAWVLSDLTHRKTPKGMLRFLSGWLTRANDKRGSAQRPMTFSAQAEADTRAGLLAYRQRAQETPREPERLGPSLDGLGLGAVIRRIR